MSTNIELLSVNNKLIQIQNDVREFFNWDVKLDEDSAIELLSTPPLMYGQDLRD